MSRPRPRVPIDRSAVATTETLARHAAPCAASCALGAAWCRSPAMRCRCSTRAGIIAEHLHTREQAGLFDVSHMGQAFLFGPTCDAARALETLVPGRHRRACARAAALHAVARRRWRHPRRSDGDPLARPGGDGGCILVVNAATKDADFAHIAARLPAPCGSDASADRALLALQGPKAAAVLARHLARRRATGVHGGRARADCRRHRLPSSRRSGYTGEDGFEISVARRRRPRSAERCWPSPKCCRSASARAIRCGSKPGFASTATTSTTTTSPVEAGLAWSIQKRRREEGGFPGAARIQRELAARPGAQARRHPARRPGAGPRRRRDRDDAGRRASSAASHRGGFGAERRRARSRWAMSTPASPRRGTSRSDGARQARCRRVAPMPFVPHRYRALIP